MHAKWRHTGVSRVERILQKNTMYTTGGGEDGGGGEVWEKDTRPL